MIACVSPTESDFSETVSTLRYAARTRGICNLVKVNIGSDAAEFGPLLEEISALKSQLYSETCLYNELETKYKELQNQFECKGYTAGGLEKSETMVDKDTNMSQLEETINELQLSNTAIFNQFKNATVQSLKTTLEATSATIVEKTRLQIENIQSDNNVQDIYRGIEFLGDLAADLSRRNEETSESLLNTQCQLETARLENMSELDKNQGVISSLQVQVEDVTRELHEAKKLSEMYLSELQTTKATLELALANITKDAETKAQLHEEKQKMRDLQEELLQVKASLANECKPPFRKSISSMTLVEETEDEELKQRYKTLLATLQTLKTIVAKN